MIENLRAVYSEIMDPFDIGNSTFHNNTYSGTLYVPKGTVEKYKQKEGWKDFVKIEERELQLFLSASPSGGEVERGTKVVLSVKNDLGNDVNDATIYYTIDGSEPTTNSIRYEDGVTIDNDITLRAIAVKEGYQQGELAATTYTVRNILAESVSLDIKSKTLNVDEQFTLTATITPDDADDKTLKWTSDNEQVAIVKDNNSLTAEVTDATIYYSTDGSAPTEQSEVYTTPIVLEKSFTLRAIDKVTFSAKGATVKTSTDVNTIGAGSKGVFRPTS